ncbi:MAG: ECF transporter S component [Anaerovibrio sp.]|uniref:ECF transporter S component n=1 Tax=Anaerovibrio sp. TaxID=1872532 RepID=UPI0026015683|nr:ECF transporter S component [Anaerovibrio sp.]MCR5176477.1 ECF transporter S component [Anaerovibrio sp.]
MPTKAYVLCLSAIFMAIICVATMIIQIPIPLGYAHLGDCVILLSAMCLDTSHAVLVSAVGSMLADFFTGFAIWCIPTLVIKGIMALIAAYMFTHDKIITGGIAALVFMTFGYTAAGALLYDSLEAGLASTPGLLLKSALNLVIFIFLSKHIPAFLKLKR